MPVIKLNVPSLLKAKLMHIIAEVKTSPETNCTMEEMIADELISKGLFFSPCKIGQTVYCIRYDKARKPYVKALTVRSITLFDNDSFTVFTTKEDMWNKTVFASKKEAEIAIMLSKVY